MKKGIDVSEFNGIIDWSNVKNAGIDFAILRSTFGSEYPSQIDDQYFQNAQGCVKNNIPFGIYHFAYFANEQEAVNEANFAIKKADEYKDYVRFIALDIEDDTQSYVSKNGHNPNWTACSVAFLERVKEAGYMPVLYANYSWLKNNMDYNKLKGYKLWYAAPDASKPAYDCAIWQYSWKGQVSGICTDVDMNYCYDDTLFTSGKSTSTSASSMNDKTKFLNVARDYVGKNGDFVCNTKLGLNMIVDWCAFSVSAIMQDCGFIGKYIKEVEGGAGSIPRGSDGMYGKWFKKGTDAPQAGDLFFLRYADYPNNDKYFCDHVGIVESVDGNAITTLEGNVDGTYGNWQKTSTFTRKTRYLSNNTVYAFYRPNWQVSKSTSTASTVENDVKIYQIESSVKVDFKTTVVVTDGVNIRQGAGTSFNILGVIPCGETVAISNLTSGGEYKWGLTTYNGVKGWIALDYTERVIEDLKQGDRVKVKSNAVVYGTTTKLNSFVYKTIYQVIEISGSRAVIGINGQVTTAIDKKYLEKV